MKSKKEIEAKIKDLSEYIEECHTRGVVAPLYEDCVQVLKLVLISDKEEIEKAWDNVKVIAPYYYGEDRKIAEEKREQFYNKYLKGKSRTNKNLVKLWEMYDNSEVPPYGEYRWHLYLTLGWLLEEKDSHGVPFENSI